MARFETLWLQEADLKEETHEISSEIIKFLQKLLKLLPHVFDTQMHLWDQKSQKSHHKNNQNKSPLSENGLKEGDRVLFQLLKLKEIS